MTDEQRTSAFNGVEPYRAKTAGKELKYVYGPNSYLETFGLIQEEQPTQDRSYDASFSL